MAARNVRYGSLADIGLPIRDVRFAAESGHVQRRNRCLLCAKSGHPGARTPHSQGDVVGAVLRLDLDLAKPFGEVWPVGARPRTRARLAAPMLVTHGLIF